MTDPSWRDLVRPALRDIDRYDPGPGRAELKEELGVPELLTLNWNEDLFGPPQSVLDAAAASLPFSWEYPDDALTIFKRIVAESLGLPVESITPGHGAQSMILTIAETVLDANSTTVIPTSTYGLYEQACKATGATIVRVPNSGLDLDLDGVAAAAHESGAKLVWICDPNNPTGLTLSEVEWHAFLEKLPESCAVVADEAYVSFREGDGSMRIQDVRDGRHVIVIRTFSKIFGMAGMRLGYAAAAPEISHVLNAMQGPFCVNRTALAAGTAAVAETEFVWKRREEVATARDMLAGLLSAEGMEPVPSAGNFIFVNVGVDDMALSDGLAERGVLIRPGSDFELPGYIRVTVGPEPLMNAGAKAIIEVRAGLEPIT